VLDTTYFLAALIVWAKGIEAAIDRYVTMTRATPQLVILMSS
jgi:hypothetical protein